MKRHDRILIGFLVVQVALGVLVFWPQPASTGGGEPLFPDLTVGDITLLSVADADGNSIRLKADDGEWVLPDADDYPAGAGKVNPVLEMIAGLNTGRLVTRTGASHKRLQVAVDDFVRRVEFETTDGTRRTLYLGSSPQYNTTHFRMDGQSEVYLTSPFSVWEVGATAEGWIDPVYLRVPREDITKVTLKNAGGEFVFTMDATDDATSGSWTMLGLAEDETLNENQVSLLVSQAASISMVAPLGKEEKQTYGMEEPSAVITLEMGEEAITIRVGAKDPEANSYVVKASTEPYYATVSQYGVNYLVESTREDFLEVPLTPASEEGTATP